MEAMAVDESLRKVAEVVLPYDLTHTEVIKI